MDMFNRDNFDFSPQYAPPEARYTGSHEDVRQEIAESRQENEKHHREQIDILNAIERNTKNLYALVDLVSKSNEQQDEIIALIADVMSIAKANSKNEADSLYEQTFGKIADRIKDAEALSKLLPFATMVYEFVKARFGG